MRTSQNGSIGFFYIHTDNLNTPIRLTRTSDNVVMWRWDHEPYGVGVPDEDADANGAFVFFNSRMPGQFYDGEAGTIYNYFRDYDPYTGRYLQSDPIGLAGGLNTYGYARANPVTFIDQNGLAPLPRTRTPGYSIPTFPPEIAIPGSPANNAWVKNAWDQTTAPSDSLPSSPAKTAENCQDPDECAQLNRNVQNAKARVSGLGACRAGMPPAQLTERYYAWLELATARSIHDQRCWNGANNGHQIAQASAWEDVGNCANLLGR